MSLSIKKFEIKVVNPQCVVINHRDVMTELRSYFIHQSFTESSKAMSIETDADFNSQEVNELKAQQALDFATLYVTYEDTLILLLNNYDKISNPELKEVVGFLGADSGCQKEPIVPYRLYGELINNNNAHDCDNFYSAKGELSFNAPINKHGVGHPYLARSILHISGGTFLGGSIFLLALAIAIH